MNEPNMVDHPQHYNAGGIECIEAIRAALTPEEFRGFVKGNAIKYCWRSNHKNGDEDLEKAFWYLGDYLRNRSKNEGEKPMTQPIKTVQLPEGVAPAQINDLVNAAHQNAIAKGWWDEPRSFGEIIALIHSEASEALEDFRAGKQPDEVWYENGDKPCGIPSELADIVIRVLDAAGRYGIDLETAIAEKMAYNSTRPVRHGGKVL